MLHQQEYHQFLYNIFQMVHNFCTMCTMQILYYYHHLKYMYQNNHKDLILLILLKIYSIMVWIITIWFTINNMPFFVGNFEFSLSKPFNKSRIFCVCIIYMVVTEFCEKLKVVSFDFSIMKNIVAPLALSSFPVKLICCGSLNLVCVHKSIEINL